MRPPAHAWTVVVWGGAFSLTTAGWKFKKKAYTHTHTETQLDRRLFLRHGQRAGVTRTVEGSLPCPANGGATDAARPVLALALAPEGSSKEQAARQSSSPIPKGRAGHDSDACAQAIGLVATGHGQRGAVAYGYRTESAKPVRVLAENSAICLFGRGRGRAGGRSGGWQWQWQGKRRTRRQAHTESVTWRSVVGLRCRAVRRESVRTYVLLVVLYPSRPSVSS